MTQTEVSIPYKVGFKDYLLLTKPGIIGGNLLTAAAGWSLGSGAESSVMALLLVLIGLSGVIGSGCVLNNYLDRWQDQHMVRTQKRATAQGGITFLSIALLSCALCVGGSMLIAYYGNLYAMSLALIGWGLYVGVYTPLKTRTTRATEIGSIAGAIPPVVGYVATAGQWNSTSMCLLLLLVCWQMPHFYAIGAYRLSDYKAASIPVLPWKKGMDVAVRLSKNYICGFFLSSCALGMVCDLSAVYYLAMVVLSIFWMQACFDSIEDENGIARWGRKVFIRSLVVITSFCLIILIV